jgi:hypothetical protein
MNSMKEEEEERRASKPKAMLQVLHFPLHLYYFPPNPVCSNPTPCFLQTTVSTSATLNDGSFLSPPPNVPPVLSSPVIGFSFAIAPRPDTGSLSSDASSRAFSYQARSRCPAAPPSPDWSPLPASSPAGSPIGLDSSISDNASPSPLPSGCINKLKRKIIDDTADSDDVAIDSATSTENESDDSKETGTTSSLSKFDTSNDPTLNNDELDPNVSIPNDDETHSKFVFHKYGQKHLKKGEEKGCVKKYYRCSHNLCNARCFVFKHPSGTTTTKHHGFHAHQPSRKPHTRKAVKEKALDYFSVNVNPSVAHKKFINEVPTPLSPADVPSLSQLKNWKYRDSMKDMPSGM